MVAVVRKGLGASPSEGLKWMKTSSRKHITGDPRMKLRLVSAGVKSTSSEPVGARC
jgi:hypothetical protein